MILKILIRSTLLLVYGLMLFLVCTLLGAAASIVFAMPWWYILGGTVVGTVVVLCYASKLRQDEVGNNDLS